MNFRKIAIAALVSTAALMAAAPSAFAFHGGGFGGGHGGGFGGGHGGFGGHGGGFGHGGFGHGGFGHGGFGRVGYYGGCYPVRYINDYGDVVVTTRCY